MKYKSNLTNKEDELANILSKAFGKYEKEKTIKSFDSYLNGNVSLFVAIH